MSIEYTLHMAQEQANRERRQITVYQKPNGSYLFCAAGMLSAILPYLNLAPNERLVLVETLSPNIITTNTSS